MTRQTIFNIRRCLHATFGEKEVELSYGIQIPFGGMTGTGGRQIENQTNEQLQRTKQKNNLNLCWALSRKHAGETLRASYTHTHTHTCARVHTLEIISQLITYWCVCVCANANGDRRTVHSQRPLEIPGAHYARTTYTKTQSCAPAHNH